MTPRWAYFSQQDQATFRTTVAFLNGRLEERATIDWALQLKPSDDIKRTAVLDLLNGPNGGTLHEPWRSAWRLIEESWDNPVIESHASEGAYHVQQRIRSGDRSGTLVEKIVQLVAPKLKVEAFSRIDPHFRKLSMRPKSFEDLFSTGLTSGELINPALLELEVITDRPFVTALASMLDAAVAGGLEIARRIGWHGERQLWRLGLLHRVYYLPPAERANGEQEPDEFHRGIAPSVKLLHAAVQRLVALDVSTAIEFVDRWKLTNSPIHLRLWAALSRDSRVSSADETSKLILSLNDRRFWNLHEFPEIAELRALRFAEFDNAARGAITARIRKLPPRDHWPKKVDAARVKEARSYWAIREMRRIEIAGTELSRNDKSWLESRIDQFPELTQMKRVDYGFLGAARAYFVPPNPDRRFDLLTGVDRLRELESALSSTRHRWDDDPASRAADWIVEQENATRVVADFESTPDGGAAFPTVWERFGWAHSPLTKQCEDGSQRNLPGEAKRVLKLLADLPDETLRQAIGGISHWLDSWNKQVATMRKGLKVWLRVWPIAVKITNAMPPAENEMQYNHVSESSDELQPMNLDTLNTPAGKLVGVFLAACPDLQKCNRPFRARSIAGIMRNQIINAPDQSGLIARHRMIEHLPYFLLADSDWTNKHLVAPMNADDKEALDLWRALARQTQFKAVLKVIGGAMAERATDRRIDRKTRSSLAFSLVIECLHAFREQREPAVPFARVLQMIRSVDDEIRASSAEGVPRFVRDLSDIKSLEPHAVRREDLFRSAAAPFLEKVWPQERTLATPGVSRAFADLPATSGDAFAEAVFAIERFLVPFDCWSMLDYGLYGDEDGKPKLSQINNPDKARAFLRLLDATIGSTEDSVIPYGLPDALDQISRAAPNLVEARAFRRLATASRR